MKKILAVAAIAFSLLSTSCNNNVKGNPDVLCSVACQKIIDSLQGVIARAGISTLPQKPDTLGMVGSLDSVILVKDTAGKLVRCWKNYVTGLGAQKFDTIYSYMLNANVLRNYVLNDTSIKYLDVYIGLDSAVTPAAITLVYVGAKQIPSNIPGVDSFKEVPFTFKNVKLGAGPAPLPYVFDRCIPCPTCNNVGLSGIAFTRPTLSKTPQKNKK
jgi:hypothetical protein